MVVAFEKEYLRDLYEAGKSDKKHRFQPDIVKRYKRGIDYLKQARNIEELRSLERRQGRRLFNPGKRSVPY